nr:hypothetical protein CFP56_07872 [Quercus suber]
MGRFVRNRPRLGLTTAKKIARASDKRVAPLVRHWRTRDVAACHASCRRVHRTTPEILQTPSKYCTHVSDGGAAKTRIRAAPDPVRGSDAGASPTRATEPHDTTDDDNLTSAVSCWAIHRPVVGGSLNSYSAARLLWLLFHRPGAASGSSSPFTFFLLLFRVYSASAAFPCGSLDSLLRHCATPSNEPHPVIGDQDHGRRCYRRVLPTTTLPRNVGRQQDFPARS